MSLSTSGKIEVIQIVEESELSIRRTLIELGISRSSFYRWYQDYQTGGQMRWRIVHVLPQQILPW